jgi:4-amino-4-deoxy-L-arabinose transferase-like glycosyltransferase
LIHPSTTLPASPALPKRRFAAWLSHAAIAPALIFGAALILRLIDLGSRPFWLDEVFTLQRVSLAPAALVHDSFLNHHMPSFFLILAALVPLGDPQFWLRVPSAAFGALSVTMVYLIGTRVAGRLAGAFAALILGLSPISLAFSQEARSYTMEMSLILVALYGVIALAMDIPAASLPLRDHGAARRAWCAFVLGSAAALDVLGDGLPWVITANLIFAVMLWKSPRRDVLSRNILIADLVVAAMCVPFYIVMAMTVENGFSHSFDWIPPLSGPRIWYNLASIYLMRVADWVTFKLLVVPTPAALTWAIDAGLIVSVVLALWRLRHRTGLLAALALSFLILPVSAIVISIWKPILLPRYILWSAAPFAILAGIGASIVLSALPARARVMTFAGIAALLMVNLLPYYTEEPKPRWDIAAKMLGKEVGPGDVVYLNDKGALPILRMYLPPGTAPVVLRDSDGNLQHAEAAQLQGKRVWAVFGHAGQSASKREWPEFYQHIAPLGTPVQIQMAGDRIYITEFDATSHGVTENCVPPSPLPGSNVVPSPAAALPPPCG